MLAYGSFQRELSQRLMSVEALEIWLSNYGYLREQALFAHHEKVTEMTRNPRVC